MAIDVLGPLPTSEDDNKYLLIAADYFTKWVEGYALPNQEAVTVADVLVKEFVCRLGVPLFIHSDQGRNFESAVFGEMCRLLGINERELYHCIRKAMAWLRDSIRQLKVSYPNMWKIISEIGIGIYLSF